MKIDVAMYGVSMTVEGDYEPAQQQTEIDPPIQSQFYIDAIYVGGQDISNMLSQYVMQQITEQAINNIEGNV